MKLVSQSFLTNIEKTNRPILDVNITLYKRWNGAVRLALTTFGDILKYYIVGDLSKEFSVNEKCLLTDSIGLDELSIDSITYPIDDVYDSNIQLSEVELTHSLLSEFNTGFCPRFIYKKIIIPKKDIIEKQIGNIRLSYDSIIFNSYDSGVFDFSLHNRNNLYWDELNRSGIFYQGSIKEVITSVGANTIEFSSSDTFDNDSLAGYTIDIKSGANINRSFLIESNIGNELTLAVTTHGLSVGDEFIIDIHNEFIVKVTVGFRGLLGSQDNIVSFGGVIKPSDIKFDFIENKLDITCYGFLKELSNIQAYNVGETNYKSFRNIRGLTPVNYYLGDLIYPNNGVKEVSFTLDESDLTGFTPTCGNSLLRTGWHRIAFMPGYSWRLDQGSADYTHQTSQNDDVNANEEDRIFLVNEEGGKIYGNFNSAEYPVRATIGYIYIHDNRSDLGNARIESLFLSVDKGVKSRIYDRPAALVVDESFVEGEYTAGLTETGAIIPYEIFRNEPAPVALYIGLFDITDGIKFRGINFEESLSANWTWYYSKQGEDADGWGELTITDETEGFTKEGQVRWEIPDDWVTKFNLGDQEQLGVYWVRIVVDTGTPHIEAWEFTPNVLCKTEEGDKFSFNINYSNLSKEDCEETIQLGQHSTGAPLIFTTFKGKRLVDILQLLRKESGMYNNAIIPTGLLTNDSNNINIWGEMPLEAVRYDKIRVVVCGDYFYFGMRNELWRLEKDSDIQKIFVFENDYTITDIVKSANGERVICKLVRIISEAYPPPAYDHKYPHTMYITLYDADTVYPYVNSQQKITTKKDIDTRFCWHSGYVKRKGFGPGQGLHYSVYLGHRELGMIAFPNHNNLLKCENILNVTDDKININEYEDPSNNSYFVNTNLNYSYTDYENFQSVFPFPCRHSSFFSFSWIRDGVLGDPWEDKSDYNIRWRYNHKGLFLASHMFNDYVLLLLGNPTTSPNYRQEIGLRNINAPEDTIIDNIQQYYLGLPNEVNEGEIDHVLSDVFEGANVATMHTRGHLLHAVSGRSSKAENFISSHQDREILDEAPPLADIDDIMQYGWIIRLIEVHSATTVGYGSKVGFIFHHDASANTYTQITNDDTTVIDDGDSIFIVGGCRFSNILFAGSLNEGTPAFEFSLLTAAQTYTVFTPEEEDLTTQYEGFVRYNLRPHWRYNNDSNLSQENVWILKIKVTGGKWNFIPKDLRVYLMQYWGSEEVSSNNHKWLMPTEIFFDKDNNNLIVVLIDRYGVDYKFMIGAMDATLHDVSMGSNIFLDDPLITAIDYPTEYDNTMQPTGFVLNEDDGYIYFALTDPQTKKKTAKIFKLSFDGLETTVLYVGAVQEDCWGVSDLGYVASNNTIFGLCYNDEKHYVFDISDTYYIRLSELEFSDTSVRDSLQDMCNIGNYSLSVTNDRRLIITDKFKEPSDIILWPSNDYILEVKELSITDTYYDAVRVKYKEGVVTVGRQYNNSKIYEVSLSKLSSRYTALKTANELYKHLGAKRKELVLKISPLFFHELGDFVEPSIPLRFGNMYPNKTFTITELILNINKGYGEVTLLEVL